MTELSLTHRILVPLDGSALTTASLPYARALTTSESEILLLRVIPDPTPMNELAGSLAFPIEKIRTQRLQAARAYLEAVAETLRDATPKIRFHTVIGSPPDEILRLAEQQAVEMIIMASHGRGGLGRLAMGSVTDHVARASLVPVMVIHPRGGDIPAAVDARAEIRSVIVPLDGSMLARQALPAATILARRQGVPMRLVRVVATPDDDLPAAMGMGLPNTQLAEEYYEGLWTAAMHELMQEVTTQQAAGITTHGTVHTGPVVERILEDLDVGDVIVMASHGEGGVRRWLTGSIAEKLIHIGVVPVILVPTTARQTVVTEASRFGKQVHAGIDAVATPAGVG